MKKNILVLGAGGMVGSTVFDYLTTKYPSYVFGTVRENSTENKIIFNYKNSEKDLIKVIEKVGNVGFVINCIGVLKGNDKNDYSLNYSLPSILEKLSNKYPFELIHISTDDVFDPLSGKVNEKSKPNPKSEYGKSKLKGETDTKNSLTIRTSFIGFSKDGKGLLEWVLKNNDETIKGYINQKWKGCTTLQFAKLCEYLIINNNFRKIRKKSNVMHFAPLGPITKHDLLKLIIEKYKLKINLVEERAEEKVDRELYSNYFKFNNYKMFNTHLDEVLEDLMNFAT